MKEFQQYLDTKGKLKIVRTEALRAGFKECWQKKDYTTIVQMAKRVPEAVIQEDPALLMYFDNASLIAGRIDHDHDTPRRPLQSVAGPSVRPTGSPCASWMSRRSGTTRSIRSGFPGWRRSNEFPPNPCRPAQPTKATGLDRITYAVAAARIADALTQDVLLAPLEAGVIPLPHQLHALTRAVTGDRVRYLLADEVGLGKTIEAGLIFRELKLRGLVKRVLVVAPKGLVTQWVQEMQTHFGEEFRLLTPSEFSLWRNLTGAENVWRQFDQVVCPVDSIKPVERRRGWSREKLEAHNQERLGDLIDAGWDLIICDEAHRLGGSTEQVARYRLGKALAEAAPYLLLLSATPHQGKTAGFQRTHGAARPGRVHCRWINPQRKGRSLRDSHGEAPGHQRPGRSALSCPG